MIDTAKLIFKQGQFKIKKPEMFNPNATILDGSGNFLVKCVNNPTASHKKQGLYRPRMTLIKRPTKYGSEISLAVEFSVAKMLYGNNVDEVAETDLSEVITALRKAMLEMGVEVWSWQIKQAQLSAFHPSKNIELKEDYTSSYVITELHKINLTKKMDIEKDAFRNGNALHFHTGSHEFVAYDKVYDLKTPEKRAMDKDQNKLQLALFETLTNTSQREILRIEVRLNKRVKMNAVLKKLGYPINPTLPDIFKKEICRQILLHYWQELIANENMFLFDLESDPQKILEKVFRNQPRTKPKEAIYLVGLRTLSREGIRATRSVIERHGTTRTWYRIAKDLPLLDEISDKVYHQWVKQITNTLNDFDVFRVKNDEVAM